MNPNEMLPPAQLMKMIVGKWLSKPIAVAAELGIADMLSDGPQSIEGLAEASGAHGPTLYRVLRALSSVGVFTETEPEVFALTPTAEYLKTGSMRSIARMFNADWNDEAWRFLIQSVRTGESAFEKAHGTPFFRWLARHPDAADLLNEANAFKAAASHRAIVDAYDFSDIETLVDVGGGYGALMVEVLKANPGMRGVVAELPSVARKAEDTIRNHGIEDRCGIAECDFFDEIPKGSDAYLLSHILHDWPDDRCRVILENCLSAMRPDSKLLVVEMIVPPGNEPSVSKLLDLEMLVITGGRERTETEFEALFRSAGFNRLRTFPTVESVYLIEAERM